MDLRRRRQRNRQKTLPKSSGIGKPAALPGERRKENKMNTREMEAKRMREEELKDLIVREKSRIVVPEFESKRIWGIRHCIRQAEKRGCDRVSLPVERFDAEAIGELKGSGYKLRRKPRMKEIEIRWIMEPAAVRERIAIQEGKVTPISYGRGF